MNTKAISRLYKWTYLGLKWPVKILLLIAIIVAPFIMIPYLKRRYRLKHAGNAAQA